MTSPYFKSVAHSSIKENVKSEVVGRQKLRKRKVEIIYEQNSLTEQIPNTSNSVHEPILWKEHLHNIKEMRKLRDAPVDTMGCERIAERTEKPHVFRFQCLLGLMLSSQTKDQVTSAAMTRLREYGCNVDNIIKVDTEKLRELIYPVSFYKTKAEHIKKSAVILRDKFNSDIPKTVDEICSLPGVGPKMAHLLMKSAWNEISGIGVDTHVHRIVNWLGWMRPNTKAPEETRKRLESWLPREHWDEINYLLVGFGQQICLPVNPKCDVCLNKSICPYGKSHFLKKKTKK